MSVVPVYLHNLSRVLPKGKVIPVPVLGRATVGAPLWLTEGEDRGEFVRRVRMAVVSLAEA